MSILIKGMEMPDKCASCRIEQEVLCADETGGDPYVGAYQCPLVYPPYTDKSRNERRLHECPLVGIPPYFATESDEQKSVCYEACSGTKCIPCKPTFPECKFCEYAYKGENKK